MEQEKKLQIFLVKKFMITLIFVSAVEYCILQFINNYIMPFIIREFFPDYEDIKIINVTTIVIFVICVVAAFIVEFLEIIIPEQVRAPLSLLSAILQKKSINVISGSGGGEILVELNGIQKILLLVTVVAVFMLIIIPYVAGAVYYTRITVKEFEKLAEARVATRKEFDRRRNLMLSDIAHDLRTPITTVAGYSKALSDGIVSEEKRQDYLKSIQIKSARMNELIQLLFDYVKLDSEGFELERKPLDICELVRKCGAMQYSDAEEAGIEIVADIPEEKIILTVDNIQFSRAITNLLSNAVKHNQKGDKIGLFVDREEDKILIMVADTGRRIPDDKAVCLFEPFVMGDESRNSRGGSGLGLSIAKKIVEMHGYTISLVQQPDIIRYKKGHRYVKMFLISIPF